MASLFGFDIGGLGDFFDFDKSGSIGFGDITSGFGKAGDALFGKSDTTIPGMSDIYNSKRKGTSGLFGDAKNLFSNFSDTTGIKGSDILNFGMDLKKYNLAEEQDEYNRGLDDYRKTFTEDERDYQRQLKKEADAKVAAAEKGLSSGLTSARSKYTPGSLEAFVDENQKQ